MGVSASLTPQACPECAGGIQMGPTVDATHELMTPESIMDQLSRQLETDAETGVIAWCDRDDMARVVADSVQTLWTESRIKTYIPVLALRRARDEIRGRDIV
jgi:hypothetical protein